MMKIIALLFISLFFLGCGQSSSSSSSQVSATNVTSTLIDSIGGVNYNCGSRNDITLSDGKFTCQKNSTVTFSISGINLGSMNITSANDYITPAALYGLESNNTTDSRILNFIQLVQSLDSDSNVSNGININQTTRDALIGYSLDISNPNTTENEIKTAMIFLGISIVPSYTAVEHYRDTLINTLGVIFEDEPYYSQQWSINYNSTFYTQNNIDIDAHIHAGDLLKSYDGRGVKIAIIDDGLDAAHEDLEGAIIDTYDISTGTTNVAHSNKNDYHGTAVTGIIGARVNGKGIQGIASKSQIIFIKYKEIMSDSETIELFSKAEAFGADIINCSWGTYHVSQAVKAKIQDLSINGRGGKGTIIVFASGNDDQNMGNDESAIPEVVAVGATDRENLRSYYSNYGKYLDVVAPGGYDIGITTLDDMGNGGSASLDKNYILYNDLNSFIGTSASAPIVSGVIALMLEANSNLTRVEIENILHQSSDKAGHVPYNNGRNNYYGYGKINLTNIMKEISKNY